MAPSRACSQVQQQWPEWEKKGLYIFFLPKYCSEMNPIELEWQQLKSHELAGHMFDRVSASNFVLKNTDYFAKVWYLLQRI